MSNRGIIGYVGLEDWWDRDLMEIDRASIKSLYSPLGGETGELDSGCVVSRTDSEGDPVSQLRVITDLLHSKLPYDTIQKLITKGASLARNCQKLIDAHFFLGSVITIEYRHRSTKEGALNRTVLACQWQIAISEEMGSLFLRSPLMNGFIPSHNGYNQMISILEKQKNFSEAISLCQQAKSQGWQGRWNEDIERLSAKARKT